MSAPTISPAPFRHSLGIALVLAGQPIAWAARGQFFPGNESPVFPAAVTILGIALMFDRQWLRRALLYCSPVFLAVPVFTFLLPVVAISLVDPPNLMPYTLYTAALIAFVTFAALLSARQVERLPEMLALVASISSIIPLVQLAINPIAATFARLGVTGNFNPLSTANIGGIAVIATLLVAFNRASNSGLRGLALAIGLVAGAAAAVLSGTRSVLLALAVALPFHFLVLAPRLAPGLRAAGRRQRTVFVTVALLGAMAAPVGAVAVLGPELTEQFATTAIDRVTGFGGVFENDPNAIDYSSKERSEFVLFAWERVSYFGRGMMDQERTFGPGKYPHLTFLHAFYDFGLAGGLLFLFVAAVIPYGIVAWRVAVGNLSLTEALLATLLVYTLGDHLTHAVPYSWQSLMPLLLTYAIVARAPLRSADRPAPAQSAVAAS